MKSVKREFIRLVKGQLPKTYSEYEWNEKLKCYILEDEDCRYEVHPIESKADELIAELIHVSQKFQEFMITFYQSSSTIMSSVQQNEVPSASLADLGFLFRELESRMDDLRKEAKARKEVIGKALARDLVLAQVSDADDKVGRVYGRLASASPDVEYLTSPPSASANPELYKEFLRSIGVSDAAIETRILDIHFKRFNEWIKVQVQAGRQFPAGINVSSPQFKCEFRKR